MIQVIIADDQAIFRKALRSIIQSESSSVEVIGEAANGQELLVQLKEKQPDVILLDIEMPIMNGIEALGQIKKLFPRIKVIFLSSHNDEAFIELGKEKGAYGYIGKEEAFDNLVKAIKTVNKGDFIF